MTELRLRSKITEEELNAKLGKQLLPSDIDVLMVGETRLLKPDGSVLCVYLPKAISPELRAQAYPILHSLRNSYTTNRGMASGSERIMGASARSYARSVDSAIAGSFEASGPKQYCRLTAWTGKETEQWKGLWPLLERIAELLRQHVPDRYAAQAKVASSTAPEWVIPGTPFTTVTINNTYATGVHQDKGDLDAGFSNVMCFRSGSFKGGNLVFPEYRVGVDLQDRDLLLMDAHSWHGNTEFDPVPKRQADGKLIGDPGFERISVVAYYRTKMATCGSAATEGERAAVYAENRNLAGVGE